jgi:hypothetical protein
MSNIAPIYHTAADITEAIVVMTELRSCAFLDPKFAAMVDGWIVDYQKQLEQSI